MKSFKLDTPKSLSQKVMLRLRQAIIEGELKLGAVIAEEMLAQSFGVSRTPVREAMSLLQAQGLVVVRPQVGSFVFTPSAADIVELCNFRILIEPNAAELAYGHDRDGALKALTAAVANMKQAVATKDTLAYGSADTAVCALWQPLSDAVLSAHRGTRCRAAHQFEFADRRPDAGIIRPAPRVA
jgi:DNA-binding GntR family transcriptional regulator